MNRLRTWLLTAATAALVLSCSSGSDNSPQSAEADTEDAPSAETSMGALIEEHLPPVPEPQEARSALESCGPPPDTMGMEHGEDAMDHGEDAMSDETFVAERAADGTYERTFGGMNPRIEVSAVPFEQVATEQERQDAADFVAGVRRIAAANGWDDPANVVRDGYRPFSGCNSHYVNVEFMLDGRELDPERPEFIMIEPGSDGTSRVTGVMFVASTAEGHGPQQFGPLATWHYHSDPMCGVGSMMLVSIDPKACPPGTTLYPRSPEMLHVMTDGPNPFDSAMM